MGVVGIKTLLEMLKHTQSLSFIKDVDFDNLPQRIVRFLPASSMETSMLPPLEHIVYVVNEHVVYDMLEI